MSMICNDWSKLCPDLLLSVFEGLNTKDYHRARTVCSNWYSVSNKQPLYPWRIIFNERSTFLTDPGEDKTHEIDHREINLAEAKNVMASCSNWLLMFGSSQDFYLLNVFTRERIDLPSMHPSLFRREGGDDGEEEDFFIHRTDIDSSRQSAVLWINERTRDFIVAWCYKLEFLFVYKKGDDSWLSLEGTQCLCMAFKDHKLYVYTLEQYIKIIDLSGDSPVEIIEGNPYRDHQFHFVVKAGEYIWKRRLAITNSGEVLIVLSVKGLEGKHLFYVVKMNLESGEWERVDSLGGEMLIFGHGVTVRAPIKDIDGWGIKSDSICFFEMDLWQDTTHFLHDVEMKCGVFDLGTSTIKWGKEVGGKMDDDRFESRWFVPGYA